jgi:hypothetical protein
MLHAFKEGERLSSPGPPSVPSPPGRLPPAPPAALGPGAWPGPFGGKTAGIDAVDLAGATALRMMRAAAAVMAGVLPDAAQTEWRELENKLHAFEWFRCAGACLGLDAAAPAPLARPAARADALPDAYTGLWAMEGLGYAGARAAAGDSAVAGTSPGGDRFGGMPARAVVPLSTGAALAAAELLLAEVDLGADEERVRRWLERCRDDAVPGFPELVAEALGLVARTLDPWRLPRLDELLAAADPALADYLWHGAGRGLYFAPMHLLPWSGGCRRAFAKARSEPPRTAGRRNATAGLAWALTLVNVRSPEVAEACLAGCGEEADAEQAVANGASSALLVWRQWAGADRLLDRFLAHRPAAAGRALRWRRRVVEPCRAALAASPVDLLREGRLAALFRFQGAS